MNNTPTNDKALRDEVDRCVEDLESRIDPAVEDDLLAQWNAFTEGRFRGEVFRPARARPAKSSRPWPDIRINRAQEDEDAMLLSEYRNCSAALAAGNGSLMCVRSNYGTGILPSLFGADLFVMEDALNTLQTTRSLQSIEAIQATVDRGAPDLDAGLGRKVFSTARRFMDVARSHPRIAKYVHIYHPDLQGPMDVVELLWGSHLFLDVVDRPELVHALLDLVTDTYIRFMRKWESIVPPPTGHAVHWGIMHRGRIMLRDDSAMNFSPDMYEEFIRPFDARLLKVLGGGAVHFCGRGDHYIARCCAMEGLHAIAMSQPAYNDMETIYRHTVDKGVKLVSLASNAVKEALARGRDLRGCVQSN